MNAVNWSARLAVTDDCIVFPVDITCGDGMAGIERVVPAEKRALLAQRGFI